MLPDNLGYLFDTSIVLTPDADAILQHGDSLTFRQFNERINRLANGLLSLGVAASDRVAVMFNNDRRFLESLFAAMRIGAIPVPVNVKLSAESIAYVLEDSGARITIVGRTQTELAHRAFALLHSPQRAVLEEVGVNRQPSFEEIIAGSDSDLPRRKTGPDELCMLPYTSGSTGKPKGVMLTHNGQIWNANCVRKASIFDDTDRALLAVPLFHKNAMLTVKAMLLGGGSLAILPGFEAAEVIRSIERWRITYMSGVPAMYKRILAEKELLQRTDLSSLRYASCGSAEVPQELLDEFTRVFHAPLSEGYGLTEGGPDPLLNLRWGLNRRGSCGRVFPGAEARLVNPETQQESAADEVGELVVRNPGLARGYWNLPNVTAQKFRDGWLYTGDLMRRDADGYYYFLGRSDDVINVAGEKVHPKEVEDLLLRHENIRDACVVPAPHPEKGSVPVAFVCEWTPGQTSEIQLKQFTLTQGAAFAHPRRIVFLEQLPLGSTGKLDRTILKEKARTLELASKGDPVVRH
jgi:acyl-CoA synthetase (AMP-forming)/AMP-acid ligase II